MYFRVLVLMLLALRSFGSARAASERLPSPTSANYPPRHPSHSSTKSTLCARHSHNCTNYRQKLFSSHHICTTRCLRNMADEDLNLYDEIEIEDCFYDETLQIYHHPCPCGDRFEISIYDMRDGEDIARCPSCSLMIRIIFDQVRKGTSSSPQLPKTTCSVKGGQGVISKQ